MNLYSSWQSYNHFGKNCLQKLDLIQTDALLSELHGLLLGYDRLTTSYQFTLRVFVTIFTKDPRGFFPVTPQ